MRASKISNALCDLAEAYSLPLSNGGGGGASHRREIHLLYMSAWHRRRKSSARRARVTEIEKATGDENCSANEARYSLAICLLEVRRNSGVGIVNFKCFAANGEIVPMLAQCQSFRRNQARSQIRHSAAEKAKAGTGAAAGRCAFDTPCHHRQTGRRRHRPAKSSGDDPADGSLPRRANRCCKIADSAARRAVRRGKIF